MHVVASSTDHSLSRRCDSEDLLAVSPVPLIEVTSEGILTYMNPSARELFTPLADLGLAIGPLLSLVGASGGSEMARAIAGSDSAGPVQLTFPEGRTFDAQCRSLPNGNAVIAFSDVSAYARTADLLMRDDLTGLGNRACLKQRLPELLEQLRIGRESVAVLCLDLDRFKLVNDTLGHAVGDALLAKVAGRLRNTVRSDDLAMRTGGDEFVVIQRGANQPEAAEVLATRLVDLIGRTFVINGQMVNIGVSIGVALAPGDGEDAGRLLRSADVALYRAKSEGRSAFRFFSPAMDADIQARRELELDLRRALSLKQFELAMQPQVQVETGELVGFEALLRWRHPTRGLLSPAAFIPLAEEFGLISKIGEWVLLTACREAASWPLPLSIAVNISPEQFRDGRLTGLVSQALAESKLSPDRLDLEITESALLDNTASVLETLQKLRAVGARISMDDFGTGYSSLSYLQKFPFDKVKIDQSFVRDADSNADSGAILRATAALAITLGMKTTAEGVETAEQLARIRAAGCIEVQGYLTGRPLQPESAAALVREAHEQALRTGAKAEEPA